MFPSTFRRLEVFIAVVDMGSFVAAADRLGISHPSVSNHIQALERQVRCELFLRRRGTASSLTEQGRRLYERGVELLEQAERLSRDLALDRGPVKRKPLLISAQRLVATGWLCDPLAQFAKAQPDTSFFVDVGRYEAVIEHMLEGRADLGIVIAHGPVVDLPTETIGREPFSLFAAPAHPLAAKDVVRAGELSEHGFITTRRDGRLGQMVENMLGAIGVRGYSTIFQIQEETMIQELAAAGLGIFCGADRLVRPQVSAGRLVRLAVDAPALHMDVHCVLPPRRRQDKAAASFTSHIRSFHACDTAI